MDISNEENLKKEEHIEAPHYKSGLGKSRTIKVYCMQPYAAFLQKVVSTAEKNVCESI